MMAGDYPAMQDPKGVNPDVYWELRGKSYLQQNQMIHPVTKVKIIIQVAC